MQKVIEFTKKHGLFILLILYSFGILAVTIKMNLFRYENFDFGKFDLGNMAQMAWYTINVPGKVMWLTDYFGTNLPRWAMSHVDPILLIFVPIFAIWPHSLTLVFSQLVLVIFSSLIVYKIAKLELGSDVSGFFYGLAYLFYPAVGFLLAWTGYHGVTAVIPFFFGAFYVYEKMYKEKNFNKKGLILFWVLLVLTMMGKEQIPLYVFMYGIFVWHGRKDIKNGLAMMVVGFLWFALAFFVIIPANADYRVEGYARFAESLELDSELTNDVVKPNYFLSRYEAFGDSYSEIVVNMVLRPDLVAQVSFDGDKPENFNKTFAPVLYTSFGYPSILMIALPDFIINYTTSQGGIGTSEIYNHRVSMIVPIIFISSIYAVGYFSRILSGVAVFRLKRRHWAIIFSGIVLVANIYTTNAYQNPVYLWLTQAVTKRIPFGAILPVFADERIHDWENHFRDATPGDRYNLSPMDSRDRQCAAGIVNSFDVSQSISGPDYLGAHLGLRETYAIFPSLHTSADVVIVDIFAQKVVRILDADASLVNDVVGDMVKNPDYKLSSACGNLFVFKNVGPHGKPELLPLQERFEYTEQYDFHIFRELYLVDFELPEQITRGETSPAKLVYTRKDNENLDGFFLYLTFINKETEEIYNVANLPSFGLKKIESWNEEKYYIEDVEIALPQFLDSGDYAVFISMTNTINTRNVYLGDIEVN